METVAIAVQLQYLFEIGYVKYTGLLFLLLKIMKMKRQFQSEEIFYKLYLARFDGK